MTATFEAPGPGPWQQDSAHVPNGWTGLVADIYPPGAMRGFSEAFARWGVLLDGLAWAIVNGFPYQQPQPFDLPGPDGPPSPEFIHSEIERRMGVAAAAFENKVWEEVMDRWDNELKPASIARHRELGDVDVSSLDDEALAAHVGACIQHARDMSYQHHRFNGCALIPVTDFVLTVSGWVGEPPTALYGVFDGYSPASSTHCPEILPAVEALRADDEARELLASDGDPAATLDALRQSVPEVDEFVRSVGFRVVDGFDISGATSIEQPRTIIGRLAAALDSDAGAARARGDATAAALRERVPAEHRDAFDELLHDARATYRLRDERGIYSDISSFGILRLAVLEAGRRLAAAGRLHAPEHVFEMREAELTAALASGDVPPADELRARADDRRELAAAGPPRHLGDPPPEPPPVDQLPPPLARVMSAVGFAIDGVLGQLDESGGDDSLIVGIAGNAGVYEGKVHLVGDVEDLFDLEDGDVLVTQATGEAFNSMLHLVGAIVTDHGSFASHACIVAREAGFPAVVGCVDATRRLQEGQRVRVDGGAGEVHIL